MVDQEAVTTTIKKVRVKKMSVHTCKGCYNNGLPPSVCLRHNKLFGVDCGTEKLIFIME